ncbi:hypothetical protein [Pedobacter glucosidilyticus]|uniref:hypothetical protein n=1 Tax=Pedobacter glucosidilyticus TaxID=1122941 RepID=UPI0026F15016|nr:hypothetical protein [Pedobacter glucosidilyticus]
MMKYLIFLPIVGVFIYYFGRFDKPNPEVGKVVFDIPLLIGKNMDQIMATFQKESKLYKDSTVVNNNVFKKDENSEFIRWNTTDKDGSITFLYRKDGWELSVYSDLHKNITDIMLSVDRKFNRIGFYQADDLLIIGNLSQYSDNYSLEFTDLFNRSFDLSTKRKSQNFYELRVYHKYTIADDPISGQIVFNVPHFINKNIDEIMSFFGKSPYDYTDSISDANYIHKKDINSIYNQNKIFNQGNFKYTINGWQLVITFNVKNREIKYLEINAESEVFNGFFNKEEILKIANLDSSFSDYKVIFRDRFHKETDYPSNDYHNFNGLKIIPNKPSRKENLDIIIIPD